MYFQSILSIASQGTSLILEGRHNADAGWLLELRKGDALVIELADFFFFLIKKFSPLAIGTYET